MRTADRVPQKVADKRARRAKRNRRGLAEHEQKLRAWFPNLKREGNDGR